MSLLNWKTIDKLETIVPGAKTYRGELCEFDVRLGRPGTPLSLTGKDVERFRIENKEFDIAVEADTLQEAKNLLREKLASSDNYEGTWKLWLRVDASGGHDEDSHFGESANCSISMEFVVELTTRGHQGQTRRRHMQMPGTLPHPFTGDFPKPTTHKDLSHLREGPAIGKRDEYNKDEVWAEATPELVETIRLLQRRLGESGKQVEDALSRKRFKETLEAVRTGGRLLSAGVTEPQ